MSKFTPLTDELHQYAVAHGARQDDLLRRLAAETAELGEVARMQIAADQGAFLNFFVRALGVRRAIEIGTFTGYSALSVARALPADGRLLCLDVSRAWTSIAQRYFEEAGVADRIEIRLGPALQSLQTLDAAEAFEFAFIDADKENYLAYYEALLPRMTTGGVIAVDNVFWGGSVLDPERDTASVRAIREFNDALTGDERIDLCMIPLADGLTLARKR